MFMDNGVDKMEKKKDYTLLIIICVILLCIVVLLFLNKSDEETIFSEEPKYKLVEDYSRFFTVNSCVYKYITYLNGNKTNELLKILDEEYIKNNNIDSNNVYNFINKLNGNYTFKSKKIYYEVNNEKVIKYFVYGYLIEETIDGLGIKKDYYVIVNLDLENQLFSITPYDGSLFKEVK